MVNQWFSIKNGDLPIKNGDLPIKNGDIITYYNQAAPVKFSGASLELFGWDETRQWRECLEPRRPGGDFSSFHQETCGF